MRPLESRITAHALEEGFDLAGIASATPLHDDESHLKEWLDSGCEGDMAYMRRTADLRADPRRLLPSCESVIVVAMSYSTSLPASTDDLDPARCWVSRYAWGRDYHRIMKKKLVRLGRWLHEQRPETEWRVTVDTAPILERAWAAKAGLGWIGKNTQLLNRTYGSELFLGTLLTSAQLSPSQPATAHCGRCTACLDACPTSAFISPHHLDARRCLAYLTIEHRSDIDDELKPLIGHHLAGCDICQEVCPWTRKAPANIHPEFLPAQHRYRPRLDTVANFDEESYLEWRRASPLNRVPYRHFRRLVGILRTNRHTPPGSDSRAGSS